MTEMDIQQACDIINKIKTMFDEDSTEVFALNMGITSMLMVENIVLKEEKLKYECYGRIKNVNQCGLKTR